MAYFTSHSPFQKPNLCCWLVWSNVPEPRMAEQAGPKLVIKVEKTVRGLLNAGQ
jgi:hypothetical protein